MQILTKRKLLTVPMHITKSSLRKDIYILEIKRGIYDIQEKKTQRRNTNCKQLTKLEICKATTGETDTRRNW